MLKNDFPFIRMVILIQQLDKKRVKIGGRNLRSKFLKVFGSGSKSELKYHFLRSRSMENVYVYKKKSSKSSQIMILVVKMNRFCDFDKHFKKI